MNLFSQTLDIRAVWALARVLEVSDGISERVNDGYLDAFDSAISVGWNAAKAGLPYTPPPLFADVPDLAAGYRRGYDDFEIDAAMARCSNCNDGTGNPCRVHG
jgi:hypothetical protein